MCCEPLLAMETVNIGVFEGIQESKKCYRKVSECYSDLESGKSRVKFFQ